MRIAHLLRAAAALPLLVLAAAAADASIIYDWTGTCTLNCSGTARATVWLDDSYVPGSTIPGGSQTSLIERLDVFMPTDGTYPSYEYTFLSFFAFPAGVTLPVQSGPGLVVLSPLPPTYDANFFLSLADGTWQFGEATWINAPGGSLLTCWTEGANCGGTSSSFVLRVPEPGAIAPFALALALVVVMRARKRRSDAPAPA